VCSLPGAGLEAARRALDDICAEFSARTGCTFTAGFAALGAQAAAPGDALVDAGALVDSADADYYATMRRSGRAAAAGRRGRPVTVAPGGPRREGSAQPA